MTNEQMVKMFLIYQESRNLSPRTLEWYKYITAKFINYCNDNDIQIDSLKTPEARQWVNWLQKGSETQYKGNSINCHIRAIKTMFNYFMEDEYIDKNPFHKVSKIKVDNTIIHTFEPDEIKKMLAQLNKNTFYDLRDNLMLRIMYDCGLRVSEIINLKITDIDTDKNMFKVFGKGHKERMVPFGRSVKRELVKYLPKRNKAVPHDLDEGYLLCTNQGTPLHKRNILRKIRIVGQGAGIEGKRLSPHTYRHSFAKQYLMAGGDLFSLQTIMGHSSLNSTRRYITLLTEDIQKQHRQFSPLDNL
ncbi:phage integrase family protein [Desulforamulus reducens MI-1]|uniref:Phage integrase family protein n=1 Tax=Desulforamulus reducens (strain ATCC BAA-1160 / DSM 100696 / MI-1) TaxID=349161 RepID=A4J6D8_DESRM|nr:tyrosine-type recombinase/integrase [Desulforamulus reducens]ABO50641.1 phage integrase family protein [Desulforamulus reducens MI-1]